MDKPDLVRNEQDKLTAAYLNNLAVALFVVGGLTPPAAALQADQLPSLLLALVSGVCVVGSIALHGIARTVLRSLVS